MGSLFAVLYHLGIMQRVVNALAHGAVAHHGHSRAPRVSRPWQHLRGHDRVGAGGAPYLERMTRSELFSLMTVGMSTVAGSVMLAYVGKMLGERRLRRPPGDGEPALGAGGHPDRQGHDARDRATPGDRQRGHAATERSAVNVIDAAAQGALAGLRLAAYVGALLIAFVALIALLNDGLGWALGLAGSAIPDLTLQRMLGVLLAPLAWLMGVPWEDATRVGGAARREDGAERVPRLPRAGESDARRARSQPRSVTIASYALCGFANFGSLAILLGGIGGLAPSRRAPRWPSSACARSCPAPWRPS